MNRKDRFSSRIAFILSTAGSAIGLANIWKFPYIVGKFGGGSFIALYLLFLALVGIPAFICEILIGKRTQAAPTNAFLTLGKNRFWKNIGTITVWTGFLVSSFYSVVAGWILGYAVQAILGKLSSITSISTAHEHYEYLMASPLWTLSFHALFMLFCLSFLLGGIKRGIELCNKLFMPLFFVILLSIAAYSLCLPSSTTVLSFMSSFNFSQLPQGALLIALGHAFFTLSVGQGTLVTYGSYLKKEEKVLSNSLLVILADTLVSLLAAFCILSIVFSADMQLEFGPGLIFETLPTIFSKISFGYILSIFFFLLVFIAALTSQVSALEPMIAHLTENKSFSRKKAVLLVSLASFTLGLPSALSTNVLKDYLLNGQTYLDAMNYLTTSILIPVGGFAAVMLVAYRWGVYHAIDSLHIAPIWARRALAIIIKFVAPLLILQVLFHSLGFFS